MIVDRYYHDEPSAASGESFEKDNRAQRAVRDGDRHRQDADCRSPLCDMLMKHNWVRRVLFLADRTALLNQAKRIPSTNCLPHATLANLVEEKDIEDARVIFSTYPTMMNMIDDTRTDGQRRFGVGHFDLVIIDEAHRSVYQKYGAIFDYFDSMLLGLTATPRTKSTGTPTACSTWRTVIRRMPTNWTRRSTTSSWSDSRRCRCR